MGGVRLSTLPRQAGSEASALDHACRNHATCIWAGPCRTGLRSDCHSLRDRNFHGLRDRGNPSAIALQEAVARTYYPIKYCRRVSHRVRTHTKGTQGIEKKSLRIGFFSEQAFPEALRVHAHVNFELV